MKVISLPTTGSAPAPESFRAEMKPEAAADSQRTVPAEPSPAEVETAVEHLNETVALFTTDLHFSVHEETNRIIVRVTRSDTGEIVREIPPERFLDAVARVQTAMGILLDERA